MVDYIVWGMVAVVIGGMLIGLWRRGFFAKDND